MDAELIERAKHGGEPLERLLAQLWPQAYRVAFVILGDRGLAEDAAQEACASVARSLARLEDAQAFHAWTYRIFANRALAMVRRRPRLESLETLDGQAVLHAPDDAIDLYAALASLSAEQRTMVLLHYYAGLRSSEIAGAIGVSPATIRFHLMRARKALRDALSSRETSAADYSKEISIHVR